MSRSRSSSKCGRDCGVCNADKFKGHGGDWMKASDRRRCVDPVPSQADLYPETRDDDDWAVEFYMADQNEAEDDCITCTWCWPARELFEMKQVHGFFPKTCEGVEYPRDECEITRQEDGRLWPCG